MIKNRWLLPVTDGSPTKMFAAGSHLGVDFGWTNNPKSDILAIDDGTVVDKFYSSTCGYSVVIQHNYSDGTHRWSGYIHLNASAIVNIGDKVTQGQKIGNKGNSGVSNGYHLHIYVSDCTKATYSWNTMKALCTFDPLPYFYRSKKYTYYGDGLNAKAYLEDLPGEVVYPEPVDRDENKRQVEVLIDYLFMRKTANGEKYDKYCTKGIYDVIEQQDAGDYVWYKIATVGTYDFWVASGGTRTKDLLTAQDLIIELQKKVDDLTNDITFLTKEKEELTKEVEQLTSDKNALEITNKELATTNSQLQEKVDKALEILK